MRRGILLVALLSPWGPEALAQTGAEICKSRECSTFVAPMLEQLEACKGSHVRIAALEKEREGLKTQSDELRKKAQDLEAERDDAKATAGRKDQEIAACVARTETAEKRAADAESAAAGLKKEVADLKAGNVNIAAAEKRAADAEGLAAAWKAEADRVKAENEKLRGKGGDASSAAAEKRAKDAEGVAAAWKAEADRLKGENEKLKVSERGLGRKEGKDKGEAASAPPDTASNEKVVAMERALADTRKQIDLAFSDLAQQLGERFECGSFTFEARAGARILKGTVAEGKHRDDAWKTVLDSPLARLVASSEIDVTAAGRRVCFVKTREARWLMARSRGKGDQGSTLFLRRFMDAGVIPLLPPAGGDSECEQLGTVLKSLQPPERPSGADAAWVRVGDGAVGQCYDSGAGWKLRQVSPRDGKLEAWIVVPESKPGNGAGAGPGAGAAGADKPERP